MARRTALNDSDETKHDNYEPSCLAPHVAYYAKVRPCRNDSLENVRALWFQVTHGLRYVICNSTGTGGAPVRPENRAGRGFASIVRHCCRYRSLSAEIESERRPVIIQTGQTVDNRYLVTEFLGR